jgi:hypothetical protein
VSAAAADFNYVCYWESGDAAFSPLGTSGTNGMNGTVYALAVNRTGRLLYLGGGFTQSDAGDTMTYIATWNGTQFEAMSNGVGSTVRALAVGPDDVLYVGGAFSALDDIAGAARGLVRWIDQTWCPADIRLPSGVTVYALAVGEVEADVRRIYDVYAGFDTENTAYYNSRTHFSTASTLPAYPRIHIYKVAGTATAHIRSFRLGSNGKELILSYKLLDGEELVIDLRQDKKQVVSYWFGQRMDAIFAPSDFASWVLAPQHHSQEVEVLAFIEQEAASPGCECWIEWTDAYDGQD